MDRDWMRQKLEEFHDLVTEYWDAYSGPNPIDLKDLYAAEPTITRILGCLDPKMSDVVLVSSDDWGNIDIATEHVGRGIGIVRDMDEWAARLAPDAPSLPADQLHPWVWDAARTFWESNHFRAAVHAAATSLNAHLQDKVGRRDLSDAKLIQEVLSDKDPEPGKPRLRIPGDQTDPGVQTRQRGTLQLGQGSYFALRNPAAHEAGELSGQEALEQLATFSVLARLIDKCQVVT
ncbi:TIGR02391 family protein [Streptomyces sp. NPDC006475]|uniref:TIGR02391 family protein n=1 Tax=Streptomyces sp. NPDC006475 TaxID=3155719 RepID=UPI0033A4C485